MARKCIAVGTPFEGHRLPPNSAREIVLADFKSYEIGGLRLGFGVAETVRPEDVLELRDQLRIAMEGPHARRFRRS